MKKIIVIIILILIFLTFLIINIYENDKYQNTIFSEIVENYKISEDITYVNKSNNFYIIKTNSKIIVLDGNFENIYELETTDFLPRNNREIVFKDNMLMYEETQRYSSKIVYNYYSVYDDKILDVIEVEG